MSNIIAFSEVIHPTKLMEIHKAINNPLNKGRALWTVGVDSKLPNKFIVLGSGKLKLLTDNNSEYSKVPIVVSVDKLDAQYVFHKPVSYDSSSNKYSTIDEKLEPERKVYDKPAPFDFPVSIDPNTDKFATIKVNPEDGSYVVYKQVLDESRTGNEYEFYGVDIKDPTHEILLHKMPKVADIKITLKRLYHAYKAMTAGHLADEIGFAPWYDKYVLDNNPAAIANKIRNNERNNKYKGRINKLTGEVNDDAHTFNPKDPYGNKLRRFRAEGKNMSEITAFSDATNLFTNSNR